MRRLFSLIIIVLCILLTNFNSYPKEDIKFYISPNMIFFSDSIGIGVTAGVDVEIGYSKFSPSDSISISPELSLNFSQADRNYFSYISLKLVPSYQLLVYSFEKKYSVILRFGTGIGFSILNANTGSLSGSGIGLSFEPVVGVLYNFLENLWTGLEFRYIVMTDIYYKVTPVISPSIAISLAVKF
ncbi:MAG: outer membrane beta-barrel protein [Brevinematia bacterium]